MNNFEIKNQYGRSMIEMLGVLAIIGVLSVGGIAGYSKAMMKYRINKTIEQIALIAGNIRTFFAPQRSYNGLTYAVIKKAKLVPDEMWEDGKTYPQNVWGNDWEIFATEKGDENPENLENGYYKAFQYYLWDLPAEACIELTIQDWSSVGVNAIYAGYSAYGRHIKTPVDLATATEMCSLAYEKNNGNYAYSLIFDIDVNSTSWTEQLGEH